MAYRFKRVRFGKNGKRYVTHTVRWGKKSPYNTKSWRYNGKLIYLDR